jgi:hypothetical protein
MRIALHLRNTFLAALLAIIGALALCAPALASNADAAGSASGIHAAIGQDDCADPRSPAQHGMPSGVLDCCEWTSAADLSALPWPAGSDSIAAGAPALSTILSAFASAPADPPHSRAASHDFIVLFGRFRK